MWSRARPRRTPAPAARSCRRATRRPARAPGRPAAAWPAPGCRRAGVPDRLDADLLAAHGRSTGSWYRAGCGATAGRSRTRRWWSGWRCWRRPPVSACRSVTRRRADRPLGVEADLDAGAGSLDRAAAGAALRSAVAAARCSAPPFPVAGPGPGRSAELTSARWLNACGMLPSLPPGVHVVLLGQQPDVVAQRQQPLEAARGRRRPDRRAPARRPARSCTRGTRPRHRETPSSCRRVVARGPCRRPSSRWTASTVPPTRSSLGGRKPTCGMSSRAASRCRRAVRTG